MKKLATTFALLTLVFASAPSMAVTLMTDSFTYPAGDLVPNGGWANFSGATLDIQVNGLGRAVGAGPNANDDHRLFAAQSTTTTTYACFDVIIPQFSGQPKPIYFAMLKDAGTSIFVSRVYVLPVAAGGWTFGISHSSTSTSVGVTPWTTPLSSGVNYHVVINYNPVAKTSTLWVNPVNELSPSVTDTNAAIAAVGVAGFGLRQSASAAALPASPPYSGTADWGFSVDNLGVGTTFAEACEIVTPAQPTTWGSVKGLYR
jgi:hypothetical protein